jgi:hypothetical protein
MEAINNPADRAERLVIKIKYTHPIPLNEFIEHVDGIERQYKLFMRTHYPAIKPSALCMQMLDSSKEESLEYELYTEKNDGCIEAFTQYLTGTLEYLALKKKRYIHE